jgi:GrpB-like predicted nucleotidyltransferase (UPF0157 family)
MADQEKFLIRECPAADIERCFIKAASLIRTTLPYAEIIHVGSTAIPGCLTKGDIDILVRVKPADFSDAFNELDAILVRSNRNEPTEDYAEFDYFEDDLPASVQLVSADGAYDDFYKIPIILKQDEEALQKYNELKVAFNGCDMGIYREAKSKFIGSLIKAYDNGVYKAG